MSEDGDSFHLDENDDAEPITAQKVKEKLFPNLWTFFFIFQRRFIHFEMFILFHRYWKIYKIPG